MSIGIVYLIPSLLDEEGLESIPSYILTAVRECDIFFVENERTSRRYLKKLQKEIVIDQYEWHTLSEDPAIPALFRQKLKEGKKIGIISEAGCPGVADPGQALVKIAHEINALVKPLAGPNSILLTLMASGMNGQRFQFLGYLPVKDPERTRAIKELETESTKKSCTQIFIETPYRNNQLLAAILQHCKSTTLLCIGSNLTSAKEDIRTYTIAHWRQIKPDLHKVPVTYCLLAE